MTNWTERYQAAYQRQKLNRRQRMDQAMRVKTLVIFLIVIVTIGLIAMIFGFKSY